MNGTPIAGANSATLTLNNAQAANAGSYAVTVSNAGGLTTSDTAELIIRSPTGKPPANDNFANRIRLSEASVTVEGSNVNATKEPGEPNHADKQGGSSVWWSWTARDPGSVTLRTAGSGIDTLLAVYTGSAVASLTKIKSNDDDEVNGGKTSLLAFDAKAGTEYQIAVDAYGGEAGLIKLNLFSEIARPRLKGEVSGKNILLAWPTDATGFVLEAREGFDSSLWKPVSVSPIVIGDTNSLKIPMAGTSKFYRLRRP